MPLRILNGVLLGFLYAFFPSVRHPYLASSGRFGLYSAFWGNALDVRALEKARAGDHHDMHLLLKYGVGREERIEAEVSKTKTAEVLTLIAPGIRCGFLNARNSPIEIGVSFPVELSRHTPHRGASIQFEFERLPGSGGR